MAAAVSSCEDAKEPKYKDPTTFTINVPALQAETLVTTGDQDDKSTFNLFCSQPDYGFSAVCEYGAQVSLTDQFIDADEEQGIASTYRTLSNVNSSQSAMSFRTYDLAVAMTELLGITSKEDFDAYTEAGNPMVMPLYFRATCRIPGVKGSEITSSNIVKYDAVTYSFAIPTAGVIYVVGHVIDPATGIENGFKEPSEAYSDFYKDFQLVEPVIGCKLYAGTYILKQCSGGADDVNNNAQWRFFTEFNGWGDVNVQIASAVPDFYVMPIGDEFVDGLYTGKAVYGQGNWGVYTEAEDPADRTYTFVVGLQDKSNPKVWYKKGAWDVEVELDAQNNNAPKFVAPAE